MSFYCSQSFFEGTPNLDMIDNPNRGPTYGVCRTFCIFKQTDSLVGILQITDVDFQQMPNSKAGSTQCIFDAHFVQNAHFLHKKTHIHCPIFIRNICRSSHRHKFLWMQIPNLLGGGGGDMLLSIYTFSACIEWKTRLEPGLGFVIHVLYRGEILGRNSRVSLCFCR